MKISALTLIVYGLFVLVGGMIGYAKAHSMISLVMGTSFAIGLILCGFAVLYYWKVGLYGGLILSTTLLFFFAYRFYLTHAMMPAGMMSVLSFAALLILIIRGKTDLCLNN